MKHEKSLSRSAQKSKHERPTIVLKPGKLRRAVREAADALRGRAEEFMIFQRGGELVRAYRLRSRHKDRQLRRSKGSMLLEPLNATALTDVFNRVAIWMQLSKDGIRAVDCPSKVAKTYLSRTGRWHVPLLAGIISAPILREDGTVLARPGYDAQTELFFDSGQDWPVISERPTRADAENALQILRGPFSEFPFISESDCAAHIAAILSAIQRPLLKVCPIFGYSAPMQRSGKSLLAESVAVIATGKPAAATAVSGEREEMRKMITSVLREGHSIVNLDNVDHPLASPDLAKALTQTEYQDRALGTNRMLRLPTCVLWTATGNNLAFRKDLSSRALLSRIVPNMERPEERRFKIENLKEYLMEHRPQLVVAALTILRAYHVAGRPRQQVKPWGGFDDWSASIREPLVWLGLADPYETRDTVLADDPEREASLAALHALHKKFEDDEFTAKRIMRHCNAPSTLRTVMEVAAVGERHKEFDSQSLGWWLRRNRDKILGGLRLVSPGEGSGVARWQVLKVSGGHGGHGGQSPAGGVMVGCFPGLGNTPAKDGTIKRFPRFPRFPRLPRERQ
jgi:putative DNA primase/helicase